MKKFLSILISPFFLLFFSVNISKADGELNLYNWGDYINPAVLEKFTAETGIKINLDVYGSNEEMLAKIQAGATGYDIVFPSVHYHDIMFKLGLLHETKINESPLFKNIDKDFIIAKTDPNGSWCLPYARGTVGIFYNKDIVPSINSWDDFFAIPEKHNGKITMLDDPRETIGVGLIVNGNSVNSNDPAEVKAAAEYISQNRDNISAFSYDIISLLQNGDNNQSISYGMLELQKQFPFIEIIHHPITKDLKFELSQNNKFLYQLSRKRWHSFLKMQKRVAPKLNKIITPSYNSKKDIVNDFKVADKNISVINNGLDTNIFRLIEKDNFKNNYQLITTASADVPLKGLDYTLYALSSLKKTYPEILLNIIGKLKKNGHTERLIEKLDIKNNIRFHSGISKEEIVQLYSKSSIAIVSSLYEGFGYPVIEAMACGVPLIATKTASIPELVSDKALLVQPKNHDEIAAGINKIFNDYEGYKKKAISNITYIKERFNWDVIALEYNKIISETITNFKK